MLRRLSWGLVYSGCFEGIREADLSHRESSDASKERGIGRDNNKETVALLRPIVLFFSSFLLGFKNQSTPMTKPEGYVYPWDSTDNGGAPAQFESVAKHTRMYPLF